MTPTHGVWMTRRAYVRLQAELAGLRSQPAVEVPDESTDYHDSLVVRDAARQARIDQINDLLANAIVGEDPPNDGVAEPGMVLTVRYDDTGDSETFLLGVLLDAVPHGLYGRKRPRTQLASPRRRGQCRPAATVTAQHLSSRRAPQDYGAVAAISAR